ncbi:dynein beta chain, ciliary-like [Teleopsis dalmanni]|uniref:dynein beta chain, ciliary-like n=1 Tax=Teleopsis dalmanni TaxID=139649 RepID=UPI0018CDD277|nr:dynein beta chain, ciliary-like [Teleopsis dalmanni]
MSVDEEISIAGRNAEFSDPRLDRVCAFTITTMRLKQDKWHKMMVTDEFRHIVLDWLNNNQRRILVMTLSPGGHLIPKNSMNDLYFNYAVQHTTNTVATTSTAAATSELVEATAITTAAVAAATALLIPLPPPSSSFSTLDGVPRGKCAYFARRQLGVPLTVTNFGTEIMYGDFPVHSKIETLAILFDDVFQPMLQNPFNRKLLPKIVCKDLETRMKDVRNTLNEIKGKTNNRTILSLLISPTVIEEVTAEVQQGNLSTAMELKFRNVLEEMFINWTTQIHEIIYEKSECVAATQTSNIGVATRLNAASGNNKITIVSLPTHEITFWSNRKLNLQDIYEQLRAPTHKSLAYILESIDSAYYACYTRIFKELVSAWHEAEDNSLWLQPLLRQTATFNAVNFINAQELIAPLVHVLHLVWINARYYRTTQRMTVLLRSICNLLVHRATEDLEISILFRADADDGLMKISKTIEVLESFKEKMLMYKEKYASNQTILPALPATALVAAQNLVDSTLTLPIRNYKQQLWRFSNEDVFGQSLNGFLAQLEDMRKIFEAAVTFQNLEKLEIGGLRGKILTERVKQTYNDFKLLFEEWNNVDIDFTEQKMQNLKKNSFKQRQRIFFIRMEVLERKLATILINAFQDCNNWEQLIKLTLMFGNILHRQTIQPELQVVLPHILKVFGEELQQIEMIVCEVLLAYEYQGLTAIPINCNFPPMAGAVLWLEQHLLHCDILTTHDLNKFIKKLVVNNVLEPRFVQLTSRCDILTTKLSNLQLKIWHNWKQTIDKRIAKGLNAPVMLRKNIKQNTTNEGNQLNAVKRIDDSNENDSIIKALEMNFSHELFALLKEGKYLQTIHHSKTHRDGGKISKTVCENTHITAGISVGSTDTATDLGIPAETTATGEFAEEHQITASHLPQTLLDLYARRDEFWSRKIKLIKISEFYDGIRASVGSSVELQLIRTDINAIDECIDAACNSMTWNLYDPTLVNKIYKSTEKLYQRLQQAQANINSILSSIRHWSNEPLHQRSLYGRNMLDLRHQQERLRTRLIQCEDTKILLNRLLVANFYLYFNYDEEDFKENGEDLSVKQQLNFYQLPRKLLQTKPLNTTMSNAALTNIVPPPLFEVKLELVETEIRFSPSFEVSAENNFQQIVEQLLQDINQTCNCIPRIVGDNALTAPPAEDDDIDATTAAPAATSTLAESGEVAAEGRIRADAAKTKTKKIFNMAAATTAKELEELHMLNAGIRKTLSETMRKALAYASNFNRYAFLWTQQKDEVLNAVLNVAYENDNIGRGYAILEAFKKEIERYNDLHEEIDQLSCHCVDAWLAIDINPLKYALLNHACKWSHLFKQRLLVYVQQTLEELTTFIKHGENILQLEITPEDFALLLRILDIMAQIKQRSAYADNIFKPLKDIISLLKTYNVEFGMELVKSIELLPMKWKQLKEDATAKFEALQQARTYQQTRVAAMILIFNCQVQVYAKKFQRLPFFRVPCGAIYALCDRTSQQLFHFAAINRRYIRCAKLLDINLPDETPLQLCAAELKRVKQLWDFVCVIESCIIDWHATPWQAIDTDEVDAECKKFTRDLRTLDKSIRDWEPYTYIVGVLKDLVASLRAITELQNPAITERHWMGLMQLTKMTKQYKSDYLLSFKTNADTTLKVLFELKIHQHEEDIKNTVDRAIKEMTVNKILDEIKNTWTHLEFETEPHQQRQQIQLLKVSEELIETLDDNQMQLQNIATSKHIEYLLDKLMHWQTILSGVDSLISNWFEVQRKWLYLESIFIGSADIRSQLPMDAARFEAIDNEFTQLLAELVEVGVVMRVVLEHKHVLDTLKQLQQRLAICEKALNDYLETKRLAFPRFYFISSADLLDILSNGNKPQIIDRHFIKLFDSILRLEYEENTSHAIGIHSKENDEFVHFITSSDNTGQAYIICTGRVELWLNEVIQQMRCTLHELFRRGLHAFMEKPREQWLYDWPAQVALCCSQICWTTDVNRAFAWLEEGYEAAMKDLHKRQIMQLNALINLLLGDLTPGDRQKIMTICTIDVHSRDVVGKIIHAKVENSLCFQWQCQLRHRWDVAQNVLGTEISGAEDCFANICDAEFRYAYEYLGNTSRLVITPLTDRCYITLTQSLHLVMGGAPAGPAGTGKTETTKDLGRALGVMVYVFNCSEQMDYKSCGNIYKGLAQTGAWGCFDEFNRISVEVLSVVAVQVKTIQEAIKMQKESFEFMGENIPLVPSVGIFITMNPGYAGRTELPENLKTLFRPCAMIVPDFALICEIMLMAEGFQEARLLARKFITLYTLCKELLSKQDHYDWGLRAIKSVLVVAGTLKRDDHSRPEDQVLMRALRDFNIPKIVTDDVPIFMGLIGDLFPALDVPRKRVFEFEKTIRRAVNEIKLQPEEGFLMKIVQLQELLDVRHSVFIVGNAGTGKTKIWQTLVETYRIQKLKPAYNVLNPKALSNDDLFGIVNPTTREWKDGLFSSIMRDQANMPPGNPKWIVLDGDIDPMWIESLNTLMDDNKILTLASNERISLKRDMRLLFEVGHLKAATPATVSRAGILYINPQDLGWSPFVLSWLETRADMVERSLLTTFFEKYFPSLIQHQGDFRRTTPITDMAMIQMTCSLLESLLEVHQDICLSNANTMPTKNNLQHSSKATDSLELGLELLFIYATMWGFGSALYQDQIIDWHQEFHKWWTLEFKEVKLPTQGNIFDYSLDISTNKFQHWKELAMESTGDLTDTLQPLQNMLIPTAETVRLNYFLKLLIDRKQACMLVGNSGSGKGVILREVFNKYAAKQEMLEIALTPTTSANTQRSISASTRLLTVQTTYFNFYTTSEIFQKVLDRPLEKKSGRTYAPAGPNRRLIYQINDLNMPEVDAYGTVQPHTIIRQFMDYSQWYDRQKLQLKDIRHCQFVASMNPTAGSFTIDPRLQRHFCVFSVATPDESTLQIIYSNILNSHLENPLNGFTKEIKSIANLLVQVGIALHRRVEYAFLPTAIKFHYMFNLRELTNIYQGLMNSMGAPAQIGTVTSVTNGAICTKPSELIRLYVHEAFRVYHDRLVDPYDIKYFKSCIRDIFKKDFEDFDEDFVFAEPLIYSHFAQSLVDQKYSSIKSWDSLYQLLIEAQASYNDVVGYMNLVMFEDAMIHVCRINRILESPRGNALLIGVGGSGKQTLARLASFISSLSVTQIQIKRGFCLQDMKDEIAALYMKIGLKSVASVFLMSDAQIPDESILTLINDLLASGEIPELFSEDQFESIINGIRNEVKQSGALDTKDNCWRFFVDKVRRLLKIVLCFSPVGQTLRIRARKFPAIISRTSIDWFHEWPKSALESVSQKFLNEIDNILSTELIQPIGYFMAYVHGTVNEISKIYLQNEKRYNYTTPKTFLEYIFLYRKLLVDKNGEYTRRIERLQSGMAKLAECARQVDMLKDQLAIQEVQLNAKNAAADKLIVIVSAESEKVKREKFIASEEEARVRIIEEDVSIKTKMCEEDLRKAEPALVAAQAALNTLNKNNLTELKSFGSPPKAVVNVCAAVMVLLAVNGKIPRDRSWKAAKLTMVRVDQFLNDLVNYNKDNIHPNIIEELQEYLKDPEFNPDNIVQKSVAAAGLCAWVINIHRYHQVFLIVGPKQKALQDSQEELLEARERLKFLKDKINEFEAKLSEIQAEFEEAVTAKQKCQREADKTAFTIDLAHRLINGLANENIRWKESVQSLQAKIGTIPGDILLISSFLSYVGCFTRRYREELQHKMWMPSFCKIQPAIPYTDGVDSLTLLSDDAQIATWNNEGLPMDRMSTENATILAHSTRWPLMIDPQLQGVKWIKNRFGDALVVTRLTQKGFLDTLEKAMQKGNTVLIEQIEETIDTVLEPLLSRALIKKGRYIRIGGKEMDFNPEFRLILHTKLANPHYKPEIQAQTTLINFTVTPDGLEEQLLAEVVKIERPDLEQMKIDVTIQQNKFKISLKSLEDDLLARLASAKENVLEDHTLVINLEATKSTVNDIELKVNEARVTTLQIDDTRNIYRAAAKRAAILYFVLTDLSRINPIYKFSLKSFMNVFRHAITVAEQCKSYERRVTYLVNSITMQTFLYTLRGLFEADKLTFTSHMILRIMIAAEQISKEEFDFLLRFSHNPNSISTIDFISRNAWGGIKTLALMEHFYGIDKDIENYPKRWRKFVSSDSPEKEQYPGEWKHRTPLQKLCILRALRPDRMTYAMRLFIEQTMGRSYAEVPSFSFSDVLKETTAATPIFFILSPGVDPIRDVERLGSQLGFSADTGTLVNISLGQGQEIIAERAISNALSNGNQWVVLQNIHLVVNWLPILEKQIECIATESEINNSLNFRLFISAEPAPDPQYHIIPQGILESSLKIVNEPPSGMAANLHKAWNNFSQETLETCTQEAEFKSILFALCYFHAVTGERRKFGPQGWNKVYPFNVGDLSISANVLHNYLEGSNRIPWEDLRYLFGEIMYGGHITDDWDRRLCQTYLEELLQQELVDGDFELCPGFPAPPNLDFHGYHNYITEVLPTESPVLYGLHPNAEIGFLTTASEELLKTIFELQPRESELTTHCGAPREELVKIMIDDFLDKLQDEFNLQGLLNRVERKTPFVVVALQECERMNTLIHEIKRSVRELLLGLKGELTITEEMESLDNAIFYDRVPEAWARLAYPSLLGLQGWFGDLQHRIKELSGWLNDFKLPCTIWLGGLFNPQSFLTAIMQESARKHDLPLDRMCLHCDVTKKQKDDVTLPPMEGAFVHALYLDGANWDCQLNSIVPLHSKELFCSMPVIYIKSIVQEKQELQHIYECPLYKTRSRGNTYVWTFNLKTKEKASKWILGGVALLLQR